MAAKLRRILEGSSVRLFRDALIDRSWPKAGLSRSVNMAHYDGGSRAESSR